MAKLLIKNGTVVTLGNPNRVHPRYSVLIDGDTIQSVGPDVPLDPSDTDTVLDAQGKIILPGFINAHTHFYSAFARGFANVQPSKTFVEVLENLWWHLDRALTLEDSYFSALLTLIDAIKNGTTTLIDHHASPNAIDGSLGKIAQAVQESGLRAALSYEVTDRNGPGGVEAGIKENMKFAKKAKEPLAALFGLHASFTLSDKTLEEVAKKIGDRKMGVHVHVAEAFSDQEDCLAKHDLRVVERLQKFGLLGPKTICAHGVFLSDKEMELLKEADSIVVHNPQSNMNNAVGVANLPAMMKKEIIVGLGTDAMTGNMLEELRSALWVRHLADKNPSSSFGDVLQTLLQNNAVIGRRIFGTQMGEIEEGFKADLILIDYDPPTEFSEATFPGHLVFGLSQVPIDTTIAGGEILMQNGILRGLDEAGIKARARERAAAVWKRF